MNVISCANVLVKNYFQKDSTLSEITFQKYIQIIILCLAAILKPIGNLRVVQPSQHFFSDFLRFLHYVVLFYRNKKKQQTCPVYYFIIWWVYTLKA